MGKLNGPYNADFPDGTVVRIKSRVFLDDFKRNWKRHHPLEAFQLDHAGKIATVLAVGYYHGGDELYELDGIPGTWHEGCLEKDSN
jgi:hypothetical protein